MGASMPTVIKSARKRKPDEPKIVARHLDPKVTAIREPEGKAHHVGPIAFNAIRWAPGIVLGLSVLLGWHGITWVMDRAKYAQAGYMLCRQGALPEPQFHCDLGELDCVTDPSVVQMVQQRDNVRKVNSMLADVCI